MEGFMSPRARGLSLLNTLIAGTTSAAATGVGMTSAMPLAVNPQLDHPFFYSIRDNKTCKLLFVGVQMNPSAG
jgi:serine protease inhibitor